MGEQIEQAGRHRDWVRRRPGVSLTREEQQQLNEIEARLCLDAPELERLLAPHAAAVRLHAQEGRKRLVRAAVLGLAALTMLILGICLNMAGLAVGGAGVMAALPAVMHLRIPGPHRGSPLGR